MGAEGRRRVERISWSGLKRLVEHQDRTKLLLFLEGQARVLEMIAHSSIPLGTVLDELMRVIEEQVDGMACSVLLLSRDGEHLSHGAAPSLPDRYIRAIDGLAIGSRAGSCGSAAFLGRPVIVTDIALDPLWVDYKDLALDVGLRACWSTPIFSGRGELLGTFAMYYRQPLAPSAMHLSLIDLATHLARIAIEHDRAERQRALLWDEKRFADRYQMVLQITREAVCEWDRQSGLMQWNGGLAIFGYDARDVERTWDWWTERIHPDDVERVRREIARVFDSSESHLEEEFRLRRKDGAYADVSARGLAIRDNAGRLVRIVGALQDITRRKRHEQEAEQLAERFRSATAAAAVGTWRMNLRTELFLADASLNRLLGGKDEETTQRFGEIVRGIHPEDRSRVVQAFDESIATGRPYESDHRVVLANGEIRWLRSRGRVLFDTEGRPEIMTGAVADITSLKHAEQSMAILADASRLLTESLDSQQILSTMARMAVPFFSDAALVHLKDPHTGAPKLAVVHATNPELLAAVRELQRTGSFRPAAPARRVLQTGRSELHPSLTPEWLLQQDTDEALASLIRRFRISSVLQVPLIVASDPIGLMVFATTGSRVYNESDLAFAEELARRASSALRNAQLFQTAEAERKRAEEGVALRERLVAIVGHDLRNPLSAIRMAAHLLGGKGLADADDRLVARIQASATRMTRMISQVLDFARIRAGMSFELQLQPANLHQICTAVVDELRLSRPDRKIELTIEGHGDAICDPDRIEQLLSNLIANAIQHGSPGPITVAVHDTTNNAVAIDVHNLGPPIPDRVRANIFDAFRREPTRGDRGSQSIGLGLFIAREIVKAHGGSIDVRSPDRDGTTLAVVLPLRPAAVSSRDAQPSAPP